LRRSGYCFAGRLAVGDFCDGGATAVFGKKKEQAQADQVTVETEFSRLRSLPIEQVAVEVMARTFGASAPAADGEIRANAIADGFLPDGIRKEIYRLKDHPVAGHGFEAYWELKALVREGLQVLENAGLVVFEPSINFPKFRATRLGTDALEQGAVERAIRGEPL
jgi:hypothetical protein